VNLLRFQAKGLIQAQLRQPSSQVIQGQTRIDQRAQEHIP
jgi:hypothetical protein